MVATKENKPLNFIQNIINSDISQGENNGKVVTRFPPEPNGYLHIGHAKSICLNFGIAKQYHGYCYLRFDDTNPEKESDEFATAIAEDITWLQFTWHDTIRHSSDYFEQLYGYAVELINKGLAFVDDLDSVQMRKYRGTLTRPGKNSPARNNTVEKNLALFSRMRAGEFADGQMVLRAKIDMASPNIKMRDPVLYRIKIIHHMRTANAWCIYPMYDFTQCISDAIEGVTHSLCTLEFEDNRPLYDWIINNISINRQPKQIEFSRLNLGYTITSKRKLSQLVEQKIVAGWDDPRMPTIAGMRRRGYPPEAIRNFVELTGVTKKDHVVDMALLEFSVREALNKKAPRTMAVLRPLKLVIENYPENKVETLQVLNHPQNESMGMRAIPFSRFIYIDRQDFREQANNKYKRLVLGKEVRLRHAYVIRCERIIKNEADEIIELRCHYDEHTLGKNPEDRKVKGVIHWVSVTHSAIATLRVYDRLFTVSHPSLEHNFISCINWQSLTEYTDARVEKSLTTCQPENQFQFEREGYFVADRKEHTSDNPTFNMTIGLRDTWAKQSVNLNRESD